MRSTSSIGLSNVASTLPQRADAHDLVLEQSKEMDITQGAHGAV
jgi:hypothetical protein